MNLKSSGKLLRCAAIIATTALTLPAAAADLKIGYVNPVRALQGAPQAEDALKKLEREFAPRRRELESADQEIKGMEERLTKDGAIMSESERTRLEREIFNKRRQLKRDSDEFREDLNFRRNEELGKIQRRLLEAIQKIAQDKKYDLIVGEGVIHASDKVDITDDIIKALKAGGG